MTATCGSSWSGRSGAVLLALAISMGCGAGPSAPITPDDVEGPFTWGSAQNVTHLKRLWFSAQVDEAGLEAARAQGVQRVIDLRAPGERDWDEAQAAAAAGLAYDNIPVPKDGPFPRDAFSAIETLIKAHPDEQILVHCSSGNRAAGWLATHLVGAHGMAFESALPVARRAGLTNDAIAQKAAAYLGVAPVPE